MSELEQALERLTWDFEEGDDGGLIKLTLDELEALLWDLLPKAAAEGGLPGLLRANGVADDNVRRVEDLYDLAKAGGYGQGLTEEQARLVNETAPEVADVLCDLVQQLVD